MNKRALITGITGQDGSYLAELLLDKGYEVYGIIRRSSAFNMNRLDTICHGAQNRCARLHLLYGDLCDAGSLLHILREVKPAEIYNLGAQSHVRTSFDIPEYTTDVIAMGTVRMLDAIRHIKLKTRFYQASSSEMYGEVVSTPQNEKTPFAPRSPYGAAKVYGYHITKNYRESYGLFAVNGILFNHESPRRGDAFVTRKITCAAARIKYGLQDKFLLGNLSAKRDWGYAKEYVEAAWLMLQREKPDDFVIATGETHSVEEFVREAFHYLELDWKKYVKIDPRYFRPSEVDLLVGDASKAKKILGWTSDTSFKELVRLMVDADLRQLQKQQVTKATNDHLEQHIIQL